MITTVPQMERTTADDVVTTAHWNASVVDGNYSDRSNSNWMANP